MEAVAACDVEGVGQLMTVLVEIDGVAFDDDGAHGVVIDGISGVHLFDDRLPVVGEVVSGALFHLTAELNGVSTLDAMTDGVGDEGRRVDGKEPCKAESCKSSISLLHGLELFLNAANVLFFS